MMHVYLKGYYGYRNIGDEVLLLGVLEYLAQQHGVTRVTLETDHPAWMQQRIRKHRSLVSVPVRCVDRDLSLLRRIWTGILSLLGVFPTLVLGGGEVINRHQDRPRNGRHYLIQYPGIILRTQSYLILGGITIDAEHPPRHVRTLLRHARAVILRDQTSYDDAHGISPSNTTLYRDRAHDVLERIDLPSQSSTSHQSYAILNLHPQLIERQSSLLDTAYRWLNDHADQTIYFLPGDIRQDQQAFDTLVTDYPSMIRWDRSTQSLPDILTFLAQASDVAASRLHLLLLMQAVGHTPMRLSYHPKIDKVLGPGPT